MKVEGLEAMNIVFLRGPVVQLTQSISQFSLTTIARRGQGEDLVEVLEKRIKWIQT